MLKVIVSYITTTETKLAHCQPSAQRVADTGTNN